MKFFSIIVQNITILFSFHTLQNVLMLFFSNTLQHLLMLFWLIMLNFFKAHQDLGFYIICIQFYSAICRPLDRTVHGELESGCI